MNIALLPQTHRPEAPAEALVVSKAVGRAAQALDLRQVELAAALGISAPSASRLMAGQYQLAPGGKPFELALLVIRMYRGLSGIFGGNTQEAAAWLRTPNLALGGVPASLIGSAAGLVHTVGYLDAARARI